MVGYNNEVMTADFFVRTVAIGLVGGAVAVATEWLRHRKRLPNEIARKILHALHAIVIVLWVQGLQTYSPIIIAEVLFIFVVVLARYRGNLAGLRAVGRRTYGEVLFPIGVIVLCLWQPRHTFFAISMLQLGVSDALAAMVGTQVKSYVYKVAGYRKSLAGSGAFFLSSIAIFGAYATAHSSFDLLLASLVVLASIILTVVENLSPYGLDNITIPLVAYALLVVGVFS